ncbi:MAG TPA: sugar ABC transporter ATP-binding protein [Gammaproteobacteria bacterium]|nr:sugar ABC transporter ATP-binding protein [Gammaproteobacteria bacterium]
MCSDTVSALTVTELGKVYRIYNRPMDRIRELYSIRGRKYHHEFTALDNISFEVFQGETIGIIGPNGSGKSTLLEIISGTLSPTHGEVVRRGTISALLELGAGFNPRFTGRENVYLNASILGIPKHSLEAKLNELLQFADIGAFIDHPVSTYSSGMYVRLAFATAISSDPDILIVDEALAVGDIRFQRKCYRRFQEMQASGKTILFVSHSVELIQNHCSRAVFLNAGNIEAIGEPKAVIQAYLEHLFGSEVQQPRKVGPSEEATEGDQTDADTSPAWAAPASSDLAQDHCKQRRSYNPNEYRWGDRRAAIMDYQLKSNSGDDQVVFESGENLELMVHVRFFQELTDLIYGCTVKTVDGQTVYGTNTRERAIDVSHGKAGMTVVVRFLFDLNLVPGEYFISLGVALDDGERDNIAIDRRYDLIHLTVRGDYGGFGLAQMNMSISEV